MENMPVIALESRLKNCRNVKTLGVKPNFSDYSPDDAAMIRSAGKIYYPSTYYADLFCSMKKETFPSCHTYRYVQNKIKQTVLFQLIGIPHPETRIFFGKGQKKGILNHFKFPFIGKIPRGSAMGRGVFLIRNNEELESYCSLTKTAYIQRYLPIDRDLRLIVVGRKVIHAYWRIARDGEFRNNVSAGGRISLDPVPHEVSELALHTALACGWNDVGIDICMYDGNLYVLEANMKYGKEGFKAAGMDYSRLMEKMIENGDI
jgi:ribosomal protein S6--L-glutamate ligase